MNINKVPATLTPRRSTVQPAFNSTTLHTNDKLACWHKQAFLPIHNCHLTKQPRRTHTLLALLQHLAHQPSISTTLLVAHALSCYRLACLPAHTLSLSTHKHACLVTHSTRALPLTSTHSPPPQSLHHHSSSLSHHHT